MKKRFISLALALTLVFSCTLLPVAASIDENTNVGLPISISLPQNIEFTNAFSRVQAAPLSLSTNGLNMVIFDTAADSYTANLEWNGQNIVMSGTMETIATYLGNSKIGVFEGYAEINGVETLVTADVNHSYNGDSFIFLTIGVASENQFPQIIAFGNYSEAIKTTYNTSYEKKQEVNAIYVQHLKTTIPVSKDVLSNSRSVDATTIYQGDTDITASGYTIGNISLFHANDLPNAGNLPVYVKANADTNAFTNYIRNLNGYDSNKIIAAVVDKVNLSIEGRDEYLHTVTNAYSPQNAQTSITLPIPYIKEGSIETFDFPLVTSSTTVTTSKYGNSTHNDNIVSWELYKWRGWGGIDMNGNHADDTGIACRATYTYSGNVTNSSNALIYGKGSLRYEYYVSDPYDGASVTTLHLTTATKAVQSSVRIVS